MSFNQLLKELKNDGSSELDIDQEVKDTPDIQIEFDRYFLSWLSDTNHGFFFTSYKTSEVYSLGYYDKKDHQPQMSLWITNLMRPMGMYCDKEDMWILSSGNLWNFKNYGKSTDNNFGDFDATYIPRFTYFGSDIDSHDICVDSHGTPYYCSALFSCVCIPSTTHGFKVWWKPPWITKIAPEDRCHLNGICSRDGRPRYVTCVSQSNVTNGWRENRVSKGIVYDIVEDRIVCSGLTMPHSPRWHNGKLWVLDAGTGWIGEVDFDKGLLIRKAWIPGFLRGMCFVRDEYLVVGSSDDRYEKTFSGLPLGDEMKKNGVSPKCGIFIYDLKTMSQIHFVHFDGKIKEIYDVCCVPNQIRPKIRDIGEMTTLRQHIVDYGKFADEK